MNQNIDDYTNEIKRKSVPIMTNLSKIRKSLINLKISVANKDLSSLKALSDYYGEIVVDIESKLKELSGLVLKIKQENLENSKQP